MSGIKEASQEISLAVPDEVMSSHMLLKTEQSKFKTMANRLYFSN